MIPVPLQLTFHSDWAVASGHARHDALDLLVRRDAGGLPYVPGKTLRGVWRDAAEQVALGLDGGVAAGWSAWVAYLWGDQQPVPGTEAVTPLTVSSASVPPDVRAALALPELRAASVITRAATAIESRTGCAMDDTLRVEERARRGCVLEAVAEIRTGEDADVLGALWPGSFLLLAAARSVERLGGRRRRGAGRCSLTVTAGPLEGIWDRLYRKAQELANGAGGSLPAPPPTQPALVDAGVPSLDPVAAPGPSRRFLVRLATVDPVLVPARTLGNGVVSHAGIPGATLLPLVARHVPDAPRLIADGALVVTDATPVLPGDTGRSVPLPLCLRRPKVAPQAEQGLVVNAMRTTWVDDDGAERQTVAMSGHLAASGTGEPSLGLRTARLATTVHNVIDDATQRPGENGVYSYEALASGQELAFEVLCPAAAVEALRSCLPGDARIGAGRSAEYGRVRITAVEDLGAVGATEAASKGLVAGADVPIWLTSDVLPTGEPTVVGLLEDLGRAWRTTVDLVDDAERPTAFGRPVRRESWQARWGLPRPSLVGISGGSCYLVRPRADVGGELVVLVERDGIGQRRAEGFGRLLVDPPILRHERLHVPAASDPIVRGAFDRDTTSPGSVSARDELPWVGATRRAAALGVLGDAAAVRAIHSRRIPPDVPRAQVGGLRRIAEGLVDDVESARIWVSGLRASTTRGTRWGTTLDWVSRLLERPDAVWDELGHEARDRAFALVGHAPERPAPRELQRRAIQLVLLAAVQVHRTDAARLPSSPREETA